MKFYYSNLEYFLNNFQFHFYSEDLIPNAIHHHQQQYQIVILKTDLMPLLVFI